VSGPIWFPFLWFGGGWLFWLFIGWWLLAFVWFVAQMGLVLMSIGVWLWALAENHWNGRHYRPRPVYIGYLLWVLDQYE
jgi:hypothetical protein